MSDHKKRIRDLYQFLREANSLRFRPIRKLEEQPRFVELSKLPEHPCMQLHRPVMSETGMEMPDTLITVQRPALSNCPPPPTILKEWLNSGWEDPFKPPSLAESLNRVTEDKKTWTELFSENEGRVILAEEWKKLRAAWVGPETIARRAMHIFEKFYEIHATIEKESEQLEVIIADGHLAWKAKSSNDGAVTINHPVLIKRVELRFDPNKPEFTVHETDRESELYGGMFVDLAGIAPALIKNRQDELSLSGYHPLGWEDTGAFLKAVIQTISPLDGTYCDEPVLATDKPQMWRAPVLILRKRVSGIANAIDAIIDSIDSQEVFPPALGQIAGTDKETWSNEGFGSSGSFGSTLAAFEGKSEDDNILFAKESNYEQTQIVKRLSHSGSVIVQGPPGTGKTHTIGNIIGHLLAHGKSVLVTSHTTKALRVLRDKVPEDLRPLCVSVLGSDGDARAQLEASIGSITERLTRGSASELLGQAQRMAAERNNMLGQIRELSHKLRQALENEYREIVVLSKKYSPSEAARYTALNIDLHSWIPSPVKLGVDLNLSLEELSRLYALSSMFSAEEERDAKCPLPDLSTLPSERLFETMVSEYTFLTTSDLSYGQDKWRTDSDLLSLGVAELLQNLATEFADDMRSQLWRPHAIMVGMYGGTAREVWERIITKTEESCEAYSQNSLALHHTPKLSDAFPAVRQKQLSLEICVHLENGGKLGMLQLMTKGEWRKFINSATVAAGTPNHRDHFDALHRMACLEVIRNELSALWDNLIGQITGMSFSQLGLAPELTCRSLIPEIRRCLDWNEQTWIPLSNRLKGEGLKLDELTASLPRETSPIAEYLLIERLAVEILPPLLEAEAGRRRLKECENGFEVLADLASTINPESPDSGCVGQLLASVRSIDATGYSVALSYARRLHTIRPLVEEHGALVNKLHHVAPGWADQISTRVSPHDAAVAPGDIFAAWTWRQLNDELVERDKLDAQELQQQIDKIRAILRDLTISLIDALAWGKQIERLQEDNSVRQALVGWLDTTKRLVSTRQISKRQMLLTEARKLMKQCANAVPVWVMPISIMAESFDPKTTRFDVVIIDEASQADLNALIPLYMAKQVIIVGDNQQVTPLGVGKDQIVLENLRRSILQDIPNAHLYDSLSSIYDIARQSFGDAIRLAEHYRCVPEIIAFSNQLSYEGSIRPLRETNSSNLKPACVPYRVNGIRVDGINETEAETIVSLIEAMIKHPAYAGKTIGVISMVGENQAIKIETMLHKRINSVEMQKRRIQAGVSAQFQGDERDIIFLSFIDNQGDEGLLRTMGDGAFEQTKKRFNVATSRARDQLWAVHSFDPDRHLKPGDIRLQLMQHMKDPWAAVKAYNTESVKADSDFERMVMKRLVDAGFRVKAQWQVGYYKIDLVVEGGGKRLAIECDGDRYHPIENLEDDIARQTVLERLGWQFVRIRGSAFYRSQENAMKPVFARLAEMDIPAAGQSPAEQVDDWTIIHELEEIAFSEESFEDVRSDEKDGTDCFAEADISQDPAEDMDDKDVLQFKDLVGILRAAGGKTNIESLLRSWAIANNYKRVGYKRIGKHIRTEFDNEILRHEQQDAIRVDGDLISLL